MIRLLTLGPAEHEDVAIYIVNQRIPNVRELWEQLCCEAIRGYQVRGKRYFDADMSQEKSPRNEECPGSGCRGDYYEKILCVMVSLQRRMCVFFRTVYIVTDIYEQTMYE